MLKWIYHFFSFEKFQKLFKILLYIWCLIICAFYRFHELVLFTLISRKKRFFSTNLSYTLPNYTVFSTKLYLNSLSCILSFILKTLAGVMVFQKQCKCPHIYLKRKHLLTFTLKSTLKFLQHSKVGLPKKDVFSPVPAQVFVSSPNKLHEKVVQVKINIVGEGWVFCCWLVWVSPC